MLLKLLVDRKGEVVSRQQILQSVWGYDEPKNPQFFLSIRGVGYKFVG